MIAWRSEAVSGSGIVHGDLRDRFDAGDPAVLAALASLTQAARDARVGLESGDHAGFARSVDGSFDARRSMMSLDPRHVEMIDCARTAGARANYTGSGGAIVAVCGDESHREWVAAALGALSCGVLAL